MTQTQQQNVPALRFPEFSGEWENSKLSKHVAALDAGVSVNSGDRPASSDEFGILKTSAVTNGVFEAHENKVVFEDREIKRLKEPVQAETIIPNGSTDDPFQPHGPSPIHRVSDIPIKTANGKRIETSSNVAQRLHNTSATM